MIRFICNWILIGLIFVMTHVAITRQKLTIEALGLGVVLGPFMAASVIVYHLEKINTQTGILNYEDKNEQK